MPCHDPEEINIAVVVDRQSRVETTIKVITDAIQQLTSPTQGNPVASAGDSAALADVQSNMNGMHA